MNAKREIYELPRDHGWTASPGYKILVLDRGAVVLEFPRDWFVQRGQYQTDIRDGESAEESSCVLAVSYLRLPPVDWSSLPLSELLQTAVQSDEREEIGRGPTKELRREDLEIVWTERRVVDERERREARCRLSLARGCGVQCLLTLDYWPEDEVRHNAVWQNILGSLRLNAVVDDPTRGKRIE